MARKSLYEAAALGVAGTFLTTGLGILASNNHVIYPVAEALQASPEYLEAHAPTEEDNMGFGVGLGMTVLGVGATAAAALSGRRKNTVRTVVNGNSIIVRGSGSVFISQGSEGTRVIIDGVDVSDQYPDGNVQIGATDFDMPLPPIPEIPEIPDIPPIKFPKGFPFN